MSDDLIARLRYPSHSEEHLRHMRIATQYEQEAARGESER